MIELNVLDDTTIQILGSHKGIAARGTAYKVFVTGSQKRVWQYQLMLFRHPRQVTITSNRKEGTLWNKERLMAKIIRDCEDFES